MFDKFKAATPQQQIQLVMSAACLFAALLFVVWFFFLHITYETLFADLKISDASTIVAEMDRKKIPYRLANGGSTILVPSGIVDGTRLDLMGGNVPLKGTVGFELFNKADMGLTDFAQKINYQRALQGELERTIMSLDGVDAARVHLSLGEDRLFRDDQAAPKASVTIHMARNGNLSHELAQGVRQLVAASVPKMNAADVVILDEKGLTVGGGAEPAAASPLAEEKRAIGQYYQARLRDALNGAGFADVTVAVTVGTPPGDRALLSDWSPAGRRFPLHVALSSPTPWSPENQNKAREIVIKTAGVAGQSDAVTFGDAPFQADMPSLHSLASTANNRPPARALPVNGDAAFEPAGNWLLIGIPALVVLAAGFLLVRKSRKRRPLDARRREEFVDRLRAILEERRGHAVS